MKIAIHDSERTFSTRWIEHFKKENIPYKIVNCYDYNIIDQLADCDGLMWNWDLTDYKAALFAKQLTISLEERGFKVFPSVNTAWHYDDKIGQKYLLEAIDAPLVPTHVFYSKDEVTEWIKSIKFPIVFKLRGGAGALNVKLIKSKTHAKRLIRRAFGRGFASRNRAEKIKSRIINLFSNPSTENFNALLKSIGRIFIPTDVEKYSPREKGYLYFQEFIPKNDFDNRVVVMRNRCYAVRRYNRKNDFRASGSGIWEFDKELFDLKMIKLAFNVAHNLDLQSVAFDILQDGDEFKIIEMSYSWPTHASSQCPGYWDSDLNWHAENVTSEVFILQDFIEEIQNN